MTDSNKYNIVVEEKDRGKKRHANKVDEFAKILQDPVRALEEPKNRFHPLLPLKQINCLNHQNFPSKSQLHHGKQAAFESSAKQFDLDNEFECPFRNNSRITATFSIKITLFA